MNHFTSTSTKPYDRHTYKLVFPDGNEVVFDDYDTLRTYWMQHSHQWKGVHVDIQDKSDEVIDTTVLRSSPGQGF